METLAKTAANVQWTSRNLSTLCAMAERLLAWTCIQIPALLW